MSPARLASFVFLCSCVALAAPRDAGVDLAPSFASTVYVAGRTEPIDGGVRIDWPGVELTVKLKGSALDGTFATIDGGVLLAIEADGHVPQQLELLPGGQTVRLASFKSGREHTVVIRKATEANYSGPVDVLGFTAPGGALLPVARPYKHALEWLGDSVSSGFGILSKSKHKCPNDFHLQDFTRATPALVARRFDAELHAIVAGGWGLTKGWVVPHEQYQFHKLYGRRLYSDVVEGTYDFASFKPEVVVVSLGSNDVSMKVSLEDARDAMVSLLTTVRVNRPGVPIILVSTNTTTDFIQAAADAFDDPLVKVVALDFRKEESFACWHPTMVTSQRWADELAVVLHDLVGW